uniref:PLD phosphodiesterase domain-containing protein n=1 Tax=Kwoniella dejecticola CBS 10117 TaxID=1296121 RepID=A0A1A6A4D2_9TREE|nr:uncharacterized protein I303_04244 [Kwoniella dejecticola CBS 10117]OBR84921.1 hypothetical protein I303_04244 [Kwoniella dejecticola CBS 10117]
MSNQHVASNPIPNHAEEQVNAPQVIEQDHAVPPKTQAVEKHGRAEAVPIQPHPGDGPLSDDTRIPSSPITPQPPSAYAQPSLNPPSSQNHIDDNGNGNSTSGKKDKRTTQTASSSSAPTSASGSKLISTYLQKHPTHSAGKAIYTTFPQRNPLVRLIRRFKVKHSVINGLTEEELNKWQAQGEGLRRKAGWKFEGEDGDGAVMYMSLLPTLERDPLSGLVPPDLLGSTTTMPLTIISLIPDIMQHYRDVIIRAEKEVFLATNYWQPSNSVNTISGALRDLSARTLKAGKEKVIVKIMYDRGSWEQLWNAHAPVNPNEWAPLDLPTKEEVQGLDMEVINFHRVLLGTFHAKFLIVDRKVALINSNNIQDRPNLEMMTHLEGPVVDSLYEVALHSWWNKLAPPLPCMSTPYQPPLDPVTGQPHYLFQDHNPYFDDIEILKAAKAARILLRRQTRDIDEEKANQSHDLNAPGATERLREAVRRVIDEQGQRFNEWKPGEELEARAHTAMKELREFRERWGLGSTSRAPSRGPSRGPSRRASQDVGLLRAANKADEEKATITSTAYGSEAPSSPTVTNDIPLKSKTYPVPSEPPMDAQWDSSHIPSSERQSETPHFGNSIPTTPISKNRKSLEISRPNSIKEKKHVGFAPLRTDFDGSGTFLTANNGDRILTNSPIESIKGLPRLHNDAPFVASPTTSVLRLPQDKQNSTSSQPHSQTQPDILGIAPLGAELPTAPKNSRGEELPLTATHSEEVNDLYIKAKKHVELTLPTEGKAGSQDGEIQPEGTGSKRMFALSKKFNAGALSDAWATVEDSDELDEFKPHVVHKPHAPFPIAMTCRKPHGFPGHHDIRNPQNAAWLAGFRYAQKRVFVQTPTLNARPIVRAVKQACRRGVDVVLLLDLGFNDKGESIPFQGGTNEEVVDRLYKILRKEKKEGFLKVYWYTGKDQVRPLNAVKKQRNCHIKFAAYDDQVAIFGNGNQDSQSWFHSQEINVMIDSKVVVSEMMETLLSNQNTLKYGLVDPDGIWRDDQGHTLEHYGATAKGAFRGLSGFIAFAKTI